MDNKQQQPQINPDHAKMFEEMFGKEAQSGTANIVDPQLQAKLNKANNPLPLKIIDNFFKIMINIISNIVPIVTIACIIFNDIVINQNFEGGSLAYLFTKALPLIFGAILFGIISYIGLNVLSFGIQAIFVAYYAHKLNQLAKQYSDLDGKIKTKLKKMDDKDKENQSEVFTAENGEKFTAEDIRKKTEELMKNKK